MSIPSIYCITGMTIAACIISVILPCIVKVTFPADIIAKPIIKLCIWVFVRSRRRLVLYSYLYRLVMNPVFPMAGSYLLPV
jgi:hypothetical protein